MGSDWIKTLLIVLEQNNKVAKGDEVSKKVNFTREWKNILN